MISLKKIEFDENKHRLIRALFYKKWDQRRSDIIEKSHVTEEHEVTKTF